MAGDLDLCGAHSDCDLQVGEPVGTHWLNQTEKDWFIPEGRKVGLGGLACEGLQSSALVRHRCRCRLWEEDRWAE